MAREITRFKRRWLIYNWIMITISRDMSIQSQKLPWKHRPKFVSDTTFVFLCFWYYFLSLICTLGVPFPLKMHISGNTRSMRCFKIIFRLAWSRAIFRCFRLCIKAGRSQKTGPDSNRRTTPTLPRHVITYIDATPQCQHRLIQFAF